MKRIVQVVDRQGVTYEKLMTANQDAFFLRMAELKAQTDPGITFQEVVANWREKPSSKQADKK